MGKGAAKDKGKRTARPQGTPTATSRQERGRSASAELYRSLFDLLPDGVILGVEGKIALVNSCFEEMIGYSADELAGLSPTNFVVPEERERAATRMLELLEGGSNLPSDYSLLRKDGTRVAVDVRSTSMQHEGKPAVLSVVRDASEPGLAEEALKEAEEWWRSVADNAPSLIGVVDRNGDIQYLNRTVPGVTMEETIGSSTYDWVLPEYRELHRKCIDTVFETGEPAEEESEGVGADGATSWYLSRLAPIMKDGKVESTVIIATDITKRKQAEEALRLSEERYRLLADHAPDVIFRYRPGPWRCEYVSPSVTTMTGWPPERFLADINLTIGLIHPDDQESFREMIRERAAGPVELRWIRNDGSAVWAEHRNTPIRDDAGDLVALEGIARDITERKRLEAELQTAREDLEGKVERRMESGENPYKLSFRELTVLHHMTDGVTDKEIAVRLGISPHTVRKHVATLRRKLKAASRTEVATRALRESLIR